MTTEQLLNQAQELASQLAGDIQLATTREEHIRVTARANAAAALYNGLLTVEPED